MPHLALYGQHIQLMLFPAGIRPPRYMLPCNTSQELKHEKSSLRRDKNGNVTSFQRSCGSHEPLESSDPNFSRIRKSCGETVLYSKLHTVSAPHKHLVAEFAKGTLEGTVQSPHELPHGSLLRSSYSFGSSTTLLEALKKLRANTDINAQITLEFLLQSKTVHVMISLYTVSES